MLLACNLCEHSLLTAVICICIVAGCSASCVNRASGRSTKRSFLQGADRMCVSCVHWDSPLTCMVWVGFIFGGGASFKRASFTHKHVTSVKPSVWLTLAYCICRGPLTRRDSRPMPCVQPTWTEPKDKDTWFYELNVNRHISLHKTPPAVLLAERDVPCPVPGDGYPLSQVRLDLYRGDPSP